MAEIELSVLNRQCLDRRIPDRDSLKQEIAAWEEDRNQNGAQVDWRFTNADARIKFNSGQYKPGTHPSRFLPP